MGSFQRRLLTHVFPSAGADDAAFQRSAGGLVGRWTDLASPSSGMTQPGIACLLCHKRVCSHFCNGGVEVRMRPIAISLIKGQSTSWLSLGADRVTRGLNCKRPGPPSQQKASKRRPEKDLTTARTAARMRLHLTPHSAGRPHIAAPLQDHTAGLVRPTKDLVRPHSRLGRDLMGPWRSRHLKRLQTAEHLSYRRGTVTVLEFFWFFSTASDVAGNGERNLKKALRIHRRYFFFLLGRVCVCVRVPRCLSSRMDGQINDWRPGEERGDWEGFPWVGTGRQPCDGKLSNSFHRLPEDWSFTRAR